MPIVLAFLLPCLKKMCVLEVKLFSNFVGASDAGQIQTSHRHPGFYTPAQPLILIQETKRVLIHHFLATLGYETPFGTNSPDFFRTAPTLLK